MYNANQLAKKLNPNAKPLNEATNRAKMPSFTQQIPMTPQGIPQGVANMFPNYAQQAARPMAPLQQNPNQQLPMNQNLQANQNAQLATLGQPRQLPMPNQQQPTLPTGGIKPLGSFKKGGKVKKTGLYKLHKGEFVKKALEKHKEN